MTTLSRRGLPRASLATAAKTAVGAAAGCARDTKNPLTSFVSPDGAEVRAAEERRRPGLVRDFRLTATAGTVDLGGPTVTTWTYGGQLPGKPLVVKAGEVVRATLTNHLPQPTTIHWHGLAIRNDADGVPGVTHPLVAASAERVYQVTAPDPGTYWFHPHQGTQLDRGLYAPLIVEDPDEPLQYDEDVEHKPHSYYFTRYPPVIESTIFYPDLDFRFRNDTPYGVLIDTSYTADSITVSMWSTKVYDSVTTEWSPRCNVTKPKTIQLPAGPTCLATDGSDGFTQDAWRIFRKGGKELKREKFTWTYQAEPRYVCGEKSS